ncbi:MAG: hypothetical protein OEV27_16635 [Nitrospira sp.]|nr:hypothetical protein [Nitrospira sp.]MDH4252807.1 hypothetical protein [Nitrospira sp.]MDH4343540.1 hypothetical protein [Nitrospira sp.]MDH5337866.1 hypothetical protein [Nitrospira sp.]
MMMSPFARLRWYILLAAKPSTVRDIPNLEVTPDLTPGVAGIGCPDEATLAQRL